MILYRAMCEKEFQDTMKHKSLSWNSRFKWFGTKEFVESRVRDGKFNNSQFIHDRYSHLIQIEIPDESMKFFFECGHREFMLDRRKANSVKILNLQEKTQQ